eukprot:TRINITY_DN40722_c0_g1_i1.p1 TRINITY_DN40722_c0_g1~~TRINITY_DN40722_c0_g1_i1.p1  ORF type:complete len:2006 (-),score=414.21 TRINITY_DN40722_c0_g1_i1:47-5998(-)
MAPKKRPAAARSSSSSFASSFSTPLSQQIGVHVDAPVEAAEGGEVPQEVQLPAHRRLLEEYSSAAAPVTGPSVALVRKSGRVRRHHHCSECGESECSAYSEEGSWNADDGSFSDEDWLEAEVQDASIEARFPRRLRFSGLSTAELSKAMSQASAAAAASSASSSSGGAKAATVAVEGLMIEADACTEHARDTWPHFGPALKKRRSRRWAADDAAEAAKPEILRRISSLSGCDLHFSGLFARTHMGRLVWLGRYQMPNRSHWDDGSQVMFQLDVLLLNADESCATSACDKKPTEQIGGSSSSSHCPNAATASSSASSSSAPAPAAAAACSSFSSCTKKCRPNLGERSGKSVHFDVVSRSDGGMCGANGRPLQEALARQVRFYFDGDRHIIPLSARRSLKSVLQAETISLDMLFQQPDASLPKFQVRSPTLLAARVEIFFEKTTPLQETAGQMYRNLAIYGVKSTACPELLHVAAVSGACDRLAGTFRRYAAKRKTRDDAPPNDGMNGHHRHGQDAHGRRMNAGQPPHGQQASMQEPAPLRLSRLYDNIEDGWHSSWDDDGNDLGASELDEETIWSESEFDPYLYDDSDLGGWVVYYCAETGILLCPLIWRTQSSEDEGCDSADEALGRPCPNAKARWAFVESKDMLPPPSAEEGISMSDAMLQYAFTRTFAWADIPGESSLMGTFDVAVSEWVTIPTARLTPVFTKEDDASRTVTIPKEPVTYDGPASGQAVAKTENLMDVRLQLLKSSIGLLPAPPRGRPSRGRFAWKHPKFEFEQLKKAMPVNKWFLLDYSRSTSAPISRTLRTEVSSLLHCSAASMWQPSTLLATPSPAHRQALQDVPKALQEWTRFGTPELLWEFLTSRSSLQRNAMARGYLTFEDRYTENRPMSIEVRRLASGPTLEFRLCVRPGVLLAALLADEQGSTPLPRDSVQVCFEWKVEPRANADAILKGPVGVVPPPPFPLLVDAEGGRGSTGTGSTTRPAAQPGATSHEQPPLFTLLSNAEDAEDPQPAGFEAFPLRKDQLRTLHWMREVEKGQKPFIYDRDVVDDTGATVASWQLRARLRKAVYVRGGVLADKIGYGKTATTIGLVASTLQEPPPVQAADDLPRIPSRATLVLCPVNLHAQWLREVEKFVKDGLKVVSLQTYTQLKNVTMKELVEADMVLATYRLWCSAPYLARLRDVAINLKEEPWRDPFWGGGANTKRCKSSKRRRFASARSSIADRRAARHESGLLRMQMPLSWPPHDEITHVMRVGSRGSRQRAEARRKRSTKVFETQYCQVLGTLDQGMDFIGKMPPGMTRLPWQVAPKPKVTHRLSGKRKHPGVDPAERRKAVENQPDMRWYSAWQYRQTAQRWAAPQMARRVLARRAIPLELFQWKRMILDEFHELIAGHTPAQIAARHLRAKCRWGLSGTLPSKSTMDVAKVASYFQIYLRSGSRTSPASVSVCQSWLDHCVRRNTDGLPDLKSEEHIVLVRQHPAERALYLQLQHAASDADLAGEDDAAALFALRRRGQEGLVKLCSHFQLSGGQLQRSAADECDAALQRRQRELAAAKSSLEPQLVQACTEALKCKQFRGTLDDTCEAALTAFSSLYDSCECSTTTSGHAEAPASGCSGQQDLAAHDPTNSMRAFVRACIDAANSTISEKNLLPTEVAQLLPKAKPPQPKSLPASASKGDIESAKTAHEQAMTAWRKSKVVVKLSKHAETICKEAGKKIEETRKAVRALEGKARLVHFFEKTVATARHEGALQCPICFDDIAEDCRSILPCAHVGCADCLEEVMKRARRCPVCRAPTELRQVMRLELPETQAPGHAPTECGRYGSKIVRLTTLLADIQSKEEDAKIIVFVQWEDLKQKLCGALREFNVKHLSLQGGVWTRQRTLEQFQYKAASESPRVLLLSLQDSCSGTNLTAASHVVLFHPVVFSTHEASVACEMQAIGRALRSGQAKTVKIWRFVTAGTIEQKMTEEHQQELWSRFRAGADKTSLSK